jgi:hypothetical protein
MSPLREGGIGRPDWAPVNSSGLFDSLLVLAFNRMRGHHTTTGRNQMSKYSDWLKANGKDDMVADLDAFASARKANPGAWLTEDNVPASRENTDADQWDALQTPFQDPANYR